MLEVAGAGAPAGKKTVTAKLADVGPAPGLDKTAVHKAYIDSKSQNYYELLGVSSATLRHSPIWPISWSVAGAKSEGEGLKV